MNLKWAALVLAAGLTVGCSSSAGPSVDRPTTISEADTPWAAIDALHHDYPGARVDMVRKVPQANGTTQYEIHYQAAGKSSEATYGTFGDRIGQ